MTFIDPKLASACEPCPLIPTQRVVGGAPRGKLHCMVHAFLESILALLSRLTGLLRGG